MRHVGVDTYKDAEMRVDAEADAAGSSRKEATDGDILHGRDTPGTAVVHRTPPSDRTAGQGRCDSGMRSTEVGGK
jgi:hypothetical protein